MSEHVEIARQSGFIAGEDGKILLEPVCGLPVSLETSVDL